MSSSSGRLEELRRRVESDPAPFVFAQLAEEYRRTGDLNAAIRACRDGLARHPQYLSVRVILARALAEQGRVDDASRELQAVLQQAPDNLAATRDLADLHLRGEEYQAALEWFKRASELSPHDPAIQARIDELTRLLENAVAESLAAGAPPSASTDFDELLATLGAPDQSVPPLTERLLTPGLPVPTMPMPSAAPSASADDHLEAIERNLRAAATSPTVHRSSRTVLTELEAWLTSILADRDRRARE